MIWGDGVATKSASERPIVAERRVDFSKEQWGFTGVFSGAHNLDLLWACVLGLDQNVGCSHGVAAKFLIAG